MPRPKLDLDLEAVISAYEGGATLQELADTYGCANVTIRKHLKRAGVQMRPTGRRRAPEPGAVITLWLTASQRSTLASTASAQGVTLSEHIRQQLGLE